MCRKTVAEIGGGDWKGPSADSSEVLRCYYNTSLFHQSFPGILL